MTNIEQYALKCIDNNKKITKKILEDNIYKNLEVKSFIDDLFNSINYHMRKNIENIKIKIRKDSYIIDDFIYKEIFKFMESLGYECYSKSENDYITLKFELKCTN